MVYCRLSGEWTPRSRRGAASVWAAAMAKPSPTAPPSPSRPQLSTGGSLLVDAARGDLRRGQRRAPAARPPRGSAARPTVEAAKADRRERAAGPGRRGRLPSPPRPPTVTPTQRRSEISTSSFRAFPEAGSDRPSRRSGGVSGRRPATAPLSRLSNALPRRFSPDSETFQSFIVRRGQGVARERGGEPRESKKTVAVRSASSFDAAAPPRPPSRP